MRFSFWTGIGVLTVLSAASCTPSENKVAAVPSPSPMGAVPVPVAAAVSPAAESEDEGDEILMVWAEAEPDEGAPPLEVQLKADVSGGAGERKVKWEFGDGSPASTEVNPKHRYDKPGTYRASVEVSDAGGDSDSDYVDIEVATE